MEIGRRIGDERNRVGDSMYVEANPECLGYVIVECYYEPEHRGDCDKDKKHQCIVKLRRSLEPPPVTPDVINFFPDVLHGASA